MRLSGRLVLALCACTVLVGAGARAARAQSLYDPGADAHAAIDSALARARADHKLVLLDLGADWCLDCVVLDRFFHDPAISTYLAAHYHVVRIDIGRFDRNLDLDGQYGHPIEGGVPAAVVLTPRGKVLVATRNGALESARSMSAMEVMRLLQDWVSLAAGT